MKEIEILDGVLAIPIRIAQDSRGTSKTLDFAGNIPHIYTPTTFFEATNSSVGTLRGLHLQTEDAPQAKLVWCSSGAVFDVLVDMRPNSPTSGMWMTQRLHPGSNLALFVPALVAHGYQTLMPDSIVQYVLFGTTDPSAERVLSWDDASLSIPWPIPVTEISKRDREGRTWQELVSS